MRLIEVSPDSKRYYSRLQAILPKEFADPVTETLKIHSLRCERNQWLDKTIIFVVDTLDPENDDIVLASLGGVAKGQEIPKGATQRIPFAPQECMQKFYCGIINGIRHWALKGLCLGLFQFSTENWSDSNFLIDPQYGATREWERIQYERSLGWGVLSDKQPLQNETTSLEIALKR
jgi:hypothetical protein